MFGDRFPRWGQEPQVENRRNSLGAKARERMHWAPVKVK